MNDVDLAAKQEELEQLAQLATYYHHALKTWGLPDDVVSGLVIGWQDSYLAVPSE